jgi:hypothetical protein
MVIGGLSKKPKKKNVNGLVNGDWLFFDQLKPEDDFKFRNANCGISGKF